MSILIKGMEMPPSCWRCTLSQLYEKPREMLVCKITHEEVLRHKIDGNCPLVSVPPHGRLIDADALEHGGWIASRIYQASPTESVCETKHMNAFTTIIEAEVDDV